MIRGSMRLLVLWVVLCLACGDIAGTYLAAVGLGGVLAGREYRRRGAVLLGLGVGWFVPRARSSASPSLPSRWLG